MKPETLYLVRHGETEWNVRGLFQGSTDVPLNARGKRQAERLAERLAEKYPDIACVYTSRLSRARETAEIVARRLDVPCMTVDGLEELCLGDWEGISFRRAQAQDPEFFERWETHKRNTRPPHAETYAELIDRFMPVLRAIADSEGGNALIVTHSACIHAALAELNGTPLETMFQDYYTPNAREIALEAKKVRDSWQEE